VGIYVEDKTTLKGAVIASDRDKLKLDTGTLDYSHIKDNDRSNNLGGGVNASGIGSDNLTGSVNATYGFTDKRQTNFATIGEGTIIVRDAAEGTAGIEGLNRDVSISQYNTKDVSLSGGFTVDKATVKLVKDTADKVEQFIYEPAETLSNDYNKIVSESKDAYGKAEATIKELANKAVELEKQTAVIVDKASNWVNDHLFTSDDEATVENLAICANIEGGSGTTDVQLAANELVANQKIAEGKLKLIKIGGKDIERVKAGGVSGSDNPPIDQHSLKSKASGSACTFSVWTMIAGYFGETKSLNDTYEDTPNNVVRKSDGWVYSETGIMKAAGVDGITVTTYRDTDAGKSTQVMVDTLNDGGKIHLRVSSDSSSHSVVVDGYNFDDNGKLYMNVRDPDSYNRYNYYDPETKQLFNIKNKGNENEERQYDKRKLLRYQTAEKNKLINFEVN